MGSLTLTGVCKLNFTIPSSFLGAFELGTDKNRNIPVGHRSISDWLDSLYPKMSVPNPTVSPGEDPCMLSSPKIPPRDFPRVLATNMGVNLPETVTTIYC